MSIAATAGYATRDEVRLAAGESAQVGAYTVTYLGSERSTTRQRSVVSAEVRIERGDRDLGRYAPSISSFPNFTGGIGTPSVRTGLVEDVYLTLVSSPDDDGRVTIGVAINPLVVWLWIGGAVMAMGTAVALLPTRRDAPAATPVTSASSPTESEAERGDLSVGAGSSS